MRKPHLVKENHLWKLFTNKERHICIAKAMHLCLILQKLRDYRASQAQTCIPEDEMMFGVESPGGN